MEIRYLLSLLVVLISNQIFSQKIITENDTTFFVYTYCEFIGENPDCLNNEIPRHIRANKTDTITYVLDKKYKFYDGKCDTICKNDSVELYTINKGFYSDFEYEAYSLCAISEGLTNMQEVNLTIGNTEKVILRYTYFSFSTPITVSIVREQDLVTITKREFNGEFISPSSEKSCNVEKVSLKKWEKLFNDFTEITSFKPSKNFNIVGADLLIEIKTPEVYSNFYIHKTETKHIVEVNKIIMKIERLLGI